MKKDELLDQEEIQVGGLTFAISRIPAVYAKPIYGEVIKAVGEHGDIGMTYLPMETSRKMLSYVALKDDDSGMWLMMDDEKTINKACTDLYSLIELEAAMIRKNFGFLLDGRLLKVLDTLRGSLQKANA